jgi:hypothetical protein
MTVKVDVEEIETTTGEKLLAAVLAAFVLIGLLWVYFNIDVEREQRFESPEAVLSAPDRAAIYRHRDARFALGRARGVQAGRRGALVDRREAYRTALDEGRSDQALRARYARAQVRYAQAQRA